MIVPSIEPSVCQVWWARPGDAREAHTRMMTGPERDRADAYRRPVDRNRFIVGCATSRLACSAALGIAADDVALRRECQDCQRPHGKPRLVDDALHLSVSHAGDWVVVAVSPSAEVGIDVERVDPRAVSTIVSALGLPPGTEADAAFRAWVRLEAALKATGDGLRVDPANVRFAPTADGTEVTVGERPAVIMQVHELAPDEDHRVAVAIESTTAIQVRQYSASSLLERNLSTILWTVH